MDVQLTGDGAHGPFLGVVEAQDLRFNLNPAVGHIPPRYSVAIYNPWWVLKLG
jgi:hypothetical protein